MEVISYIYYYIIDKTNSPINHINDNLLYSIENQNINLEPLINFELIKLIYELNPDIYEKVVLNKITEEEAQITI